MAERHQIVSESFTRTLIKIKAAQLCRRSDFSRSDYDDLRQAMSLHLLEKAHLYDAARGTPEAFVTQVLNTWVRMELRSRGRLKRRGDAVSLEGTAVEFNGGTDTLAAIVDGADQRRRTGNEPASPLESVDVAEAVRHALANLTTEERDLLRHAAEHGVADTARAWSERTGGTFSRRRVEAALARMRRRFEDAGLGG